MLLTRKPNLGCVKVPSWDILGVFFPDLYTKRAYSTHWCSIDVPLMSRWWIIHVPMTLHWHSIDHQKKKSPPNGVRLTTSGSAPVWLGGQSILYQCQTISSALEINLPWFWGIFIWFPALSKNQMPKMIRHEKHMINNWFWRSKRPLA